MKQCNRVSCATKRCIFILLFGLLLATFNGWGDGFDWGNRCSATSLGSSHNKIITETNGFTRTYRTYIKPQEAGTFHWSFWYDNTVDSRWANGSTANVNDPGSNWHIDAAYIADGGTTHDGSIVPGTEVPVTFGGNTSKSVAPNERFWSDPVSLTVPKDHYLVFTWTITVTATGKTVPYTYDEMVSSYVAAGNHAGDESAAAFASAGNVMVAPNLFAYDRPVRKRIAFLGDSITQGIATTRDAYEYWVAKIANGLGAHYAVWNLGSGYAQAQDAATDQAWLYKAKQNDTVVVCLGVNDLGTGNRTDVQILADLTKVVSSLKANNPACEVILCTVPPFGFTGTKEVYWRNINSMIRTNPPAGVDRVFDIAAVLSQPAPNDNLILDGYRANGGNHPNGIAGSAVAYAFLQWYGKTTAYYKIMNVYTGKALAVLDETIAGTPTDRQNNNAEIAQWTYDENKDWFKWIIEDAGGGYVKIINKYSGKAMTVFAKGLDGVTTLSRTNNNADIGQWEYATNDWYQWSIEPTAEGYKKIINKYSGKAAAVFNVDATGNPTNIYSDGADVAQYAYNENQNWHKWEIIPVYSTNPVTNTVISAAGGMIQLNFSGKADQSFSLASVASLSDTNWTNEGTIGFDGTGKATFAAPLSSDTSRFYRVNF